MPKLSEMYDVSQRYRSIGPDYISIKRGEQLVVIDINEENKVYNYVVDNDDLNLIIL